MTGSRCRCCPTEAQSLFEPEPEVVDVDVDVLEVFGVDDVVEVDPSDAAPSPFFSEVDLDEDSDSDEVDPELRPLEDEDERESVMYQPVPLKTMPTGWMTLRRAPPHCSHVVRGGSEKLWRFSIVSSQAVHL
jgi:hypothetical protein